MPAGWPQIRALRWCRCTLRPSYSGKHIGCESPKLRRRPHLVLLAVDAVEALIVGLVYVPAFPDTLQERRHQRLVPHVRRAHERVVADVQLRRSTVSAQGNQGQARKWGCGCREERPEVRLPRVSSRPHIAARCDSDALGLCGLCRVCSAHINDACLQATDALSGLNVCQRPVTMSKSCLTASCCMR